MYLSLAGKKQGNKWVVEPDKRAMLVEKLTKLISTVKIPEDEALEVDFDGLEVSGWDVWFVLEHDFGYTSGGQDDNGWQLDYDVYFNHKEILPEAFRHITLRGCGMTGEVTLVIGED